VESCSVVDSMLTAFLYLNFLDLSGCGVLFGCGVSHLISLTRVLPFQTQAVHTVLVKIGILSYFQTLGFPNSLLGTTFFLLEVHLINVNALGFKTK
jgi:hypothetical protein